MRPLALVIASTLLLRSAAVWADGGTSCPTAQEIFSNQTYQGDTSTSTSFVGAFAGLPSPGPDLAFKFTVQGDEGIDPFDVTVVGGWNAGAVITAACAGNAGPPISANTGTTTFSVPVDMLVSGQSYYFFITGNPSDNSGPSGAFTFAAAWVPVELQFFSID